MPNKLPPKRQRFCDEYVRDFNATQAATRAGYAPANAYQTAWRLLKRPEVQEEIQHQIREKKRVVMVDEVWVLQRLIEVTDRCMQKEPVLNQDGIPTGEWQFDSNGANRALETIAKHLGMFVERSEHIVRVEQAETARAEFLEGLDRFREKFVAEPLAIPGRVDTDAEPH